MSCTNQTASVITPQYLFHSRQPKSIPALLGRPCFWRWCIFWRRSIDVDHKIPDEAMTPVDLKPPQARDHSCHPPISPILASSSSFHNLNPSNYAAAPLPYLLLVEGIDVVSAVPLLKALTLRRIRMQMPSSLSSASTQTPGRYRDPYFLHVYPADIKSFIFPEF